MTDAEIKVMTLEQCAQQPDPQAAVDALVAALALRFGVAEDNVRLYDVTDVGVAKALAARTRMEAEWPEAPRDQHIYACFTRPASEYALPPTATVKRSGVDWASLTPHFYIASPAPLELPQVNLLRLPVIGGTPA